MTNTILHNRKNKEELIAELMAEQFKRKTVSFYRYTKIANPAALRDQLFIEWSELGVFGRVYLAQEGINAQISVPEHNWERFVEVLYSQKCFDNMPFKIAVEDDGKSFYKLTIKIKEKIVADGLDDSSFDPSDVGNHLSAKDFNEALAAGAVVVDVRNQYESEVGHFEGAICPDADTFREELPMITELLKGKENEKVLLYCTGGIRCEKASAYLKHKGFKDVNQLHGGIIAYAHDVKAQGLDCKFKGKNFVFDERVGERITEDILSECHQCGKACDDHTNCKNDACHLLFIQCADCAAKFDGCCTPNCQEIASLELEKQREIRRGAARQGDCLSVYKSRLRPKLKELVG